MSFNSTLDDFCGSPFWDTNLTWNTDSPELTPCFENTALVWAPCCFLWVFAALDTFYILNSKERNIPWNVLSISKLFITCILIVLTLVDLGVTVHRSSQGKDVFDVDFYTPIVKILAFGLAATLLYYNRKHGMRASGVIFLFWTLLLLCGMPQLRSLILKHGNPQDDEELDTYRFVSYMIYYPLVVVMFLLNCFADLPPRDTPYKFDKAPCPESASGFPSRLTFSWFDPLALTGFRRSLTDADLWALNPADSTAEAYARFSKHWQRTLNKRNTQASSAASYRKKSASVDFKPSQERKPASILPALCFAFGGQFIFGSVLKLVNDLLTFVMPQLLELLIKFINDASQPVWRGYLYAALFMITASCQTMLLAHYFTRMYLVGMRIRTALTAAIYRKALRMSNSARKDSTVGEIVNLMAVDAQRFLELMAYLNMIWSAPLQIALALYFLWRYLGPAVLAGLAVMIVLIPVNGLIANKVKTLQIRQMKYKDERVKLMNEVLNGIKVLKIYAWEPSFEEQILRIRNKEMHVLKQAAYLNSATSFIWSCAPFLVTFLTFLTFVVSDPVNNVLNAENVFVSISLFFTMHLPLGLLPLVVVSVVEVSLVSFGCFVLISETNVLDSKTAFVSLSLFNILRFPLSMLPNVISNMIQTSVGIKRLNKFMNTNELDSDAVEHNSKDPNPLVIENGTFSWGDNEPTLKNIDLKVPKGSLVAIVGAVGSGKSSLLSAFLGEMDKISGYVNAYGEIAYAPQQAWIQNATLQDNILFGKPYDKQKYNKVIEVCALKPDLEILPGGDQTEIGEKGINLSGGQKQRVSLARAVYCGADTYLLDDTLSAVDAHVGKHIFDQVIGPKGLLSERTRVWVTHSVSYLAQTDLVVVLKDGAVSECGSYQQLLDKRGAFAEFLLHHLSDPTQDTEDLQEIKQQLEGTLGSEFQDRLQRARSLSESASESDTAAATGGAGVAGGDRSNSVTARRASELQTQVSKTDAAAAAKELASKNKLIEAEKAETGSVKWAVYKHYLGSIGILASVVTIVMNLVLQVFQVGANYWLALWSDDNTLYVNGTVDSSRRDMYLGVYGALGFGQVLSVSVSSLSLYLGALTAAGALHAALLAGVLRAPIPGFFDCTPIGRMLNRFGKDVDTLDNVLPMTLRGWTSCFFSVLGTLVVISISTPIFLAVIIPIGALYYMIQRFYVSSSRQLKRLESISRSPIYSHFSESITGASTIRAYGVTDRFVLESARGVDHNQACYYPGCIANRWLAIRLEMIGNVIIFLAALFSVLKKGTIDAGVVGLSVSYALQITQTLNWLVRMTSEVETNIVAVERLKEYAETEQEAAWEVSGGPGAGWPAEGALRLEGLVLAYRRDAEPALRGVTCAVRPREKIGIVGRTGAGKSTLTLGLFRIIEPISGKIVVDEVDISTIGLHQLRSRITIIPQDPVLFSGTLRLNLDPFDQFSDDDLWRSLDHAHLKTFVKGLSAGLLHEISEGGENLSVGQRQLVCLARALLRKTPLLVLDEATAAVDLETDDLIQRTIRTEFAQCTVLTIAHRLNTIMDSTRVMVLDRGRLVEFAPPHELLQDHKSIFYAMAKDAGIVN